MTDWYVSSVVYAAAAYPAFQASHTYAMGDIIVPTVIVSGKMWVFRCTVAGTSDVEPIWGPGTYRSGTVTFENITGQSAYFWQAAGGDVVSVQNGQRMTVDDHMFVSSDHVEYQTSAFYEVGYKIMCVDRTGSTPPVAANLSTGAVLSGDGIGLSNRVNSYFYGITFEILTSDGISIGGGVNGQTIYLENCQIWLNTTDSASIGSENLGNTITLVLDNTSIKYGASNQGFGANFDSCFELIWINTPNALLGVTPEHLFLNFGALTGLFSAKFTGTCRGLDLSALVGTIAHGTGGNGAKYLLESCKINPAVTRSERSQTHSTTDFLELINCFDGTHYLNESYSPAGDVTTEFTITLSGGAADDHGSFSHQMTTTTLIDKIVLPLSGFWMDIENLDVGVSKTATVEIISSQTLKNDEVALHLHYMDTEGSAVSTWRSTLFNSAINPPIALPTSTAAWDSSPDTPVAQKLQIVFTPQKAGRLRGQVRLGIPSTTIYYNPQIILT
jgi:hypothetical protein